MADLGSLLGAAGIGGNIGKAIVQLELDTSKYAAELEGAQAKTVASTNSMGSSTSKFGSIASTAFLAAGAAAVVGLGLSIKAALEAQEAHERLLNTVKNSAQLSESSVKAFEDQAESIRSLTGADDEAIISGDALLGQMGLTQDQITSLAPRVVDLATKFNIDLNTAFKAVGKAAQGNTGSLARYVGVIEKGATPAETFANVLDKLGASAGFAAQQAKDEPWLLIKSDMEEISEEIGTALLPALKSLADLLHNLVPLLEQVAKAIQFLPLIQMSEDISSTGDAVHKFMNAMLDTIPVLGHFIDLQDPFSSKLGQATADIVHHAGAVETLSRFYRDKLTPAVEEAKQTTVNFAHKTDAELEKWSEDTKKSFDTFVGSLQDATSETEITRKDFRDAIHDMLQNARDLSQAMNRLSKEHWVNDDFIAFLSEQGPEWLIAFADMTEKQQRRAQDEWEKSTKKTDAAKDSLDRISGVLDQLDKGTSKHTFEIHYKYVGFDPTKPGMATAGSSGGQQGP